MIDLDHTIGASAGLQAGNAAPIVPVAKKFQSTTITFEYAGKTVKATDLIGLMTLGAKKGDQIVVHIDGVEEKDAAREMEELLNRIA